MTVPITFTDVAPTVSTTEWSFPAGGTTLTAQTTAGQMQAVIDLANLTAAESYELKLYEASSAGGTPRVIWGPIVITGVHDPLVTPLVMLGRGWNLTAKKLAGTDRVIPCSIRQVAGDVNVATWLGTAPAALTASGYVQATLRRWLTDDAAGTPAALTSTSKLVQAMVARWVTDDAGGTPSALVSGRMDASVGAMASAVVTASAIAANALALAAFATDARQALGGVVRSATAAGGGAQTITLDAGASTTSDEYIGMVVFITGGTGVNGVRRVVDYVGSTKVATLDMPWVTAPDNTSTFLLVADAGLPELPGHRAITGTLTATAFTTDLTEATADHFKDAFVTFLSGALAGQVKKCTAYNGTTKALSFTAGFTGAPSDGDVFVIVNG